MSTIGKDNNVYTVMVEFTTAPESQEALIQAMSKLTDLFPSQPGFVSQHYHRSHDGKRVISYLQWRSEQDHLNCLNNDALKPHGADIMALVEQGNVQMSVNTYDVIHSTEGEDQGSGTAEATKQLVLGYFQSWQKCDWKELRSFLADEITFLSAQGTHTMSADAFTEMCSKGAAWRDVKLVDSVFLPNHAALLYNAVDTADGASVRVGEFVTLQDQKVAKIQAVMTKNAEPAADRASA